MSLLHWFAQADALNQLVAVVLCAMSVLSWVLIIHRTWLLSVANRDLSLCQAAWSQAQDWLHLQATWGLWTAKNCLSVCCAALWMPQRRAWLLRPPMKTGSAAACVKPCKAYADACNLAKTCWPPWGRLPFIGLLGTVWGIYHALISLAQAGQYTLDKVTQPVGESLVMTAAGLGVAIPAVMAYNLFGRRLAAMDATLDALAFDLRAYFMAQAR